MKSHEKKNNKKTPNLEFNEPLLACATVMDYEHLQEEEQEVLHEIQEYVREITPEYLRKESLLY